MYRGGTGPGGRMTGANTMPLANRRTFGNEEARASPAPPPPPPAADQSVQVYGTAASRAGRFDAAAYSNSIKKMYEAGMGSAPRESREGRPRKRRWGDASSKVNIPGLPTTLPNGMSSEQLDMYQITLRLEEISRKLRTNDVVPPEAERSPSPPPIYGPDGKRANTREVRYRNRLESERHRLVDRATRLDPTFRAPVDYKKPSKMQDKFYIPTREFRDINFIGLLIGPRGNTLKRLEADSGAKVSIRGKGSVKEGKLATPNDHEEEDLHCVVTADSEEKVQKAIELIQKVIETAANIPEEDNQLKRMQLRELAALNGTLRDDENQACLNCGQIGHRKFECPESRNVTTSIVCRICGSAGHMARDCIARNDPEMLKQMAEKNKAVDEEIGRFMKELGGGGGGGEADGERSGHYGPPRNGPAAAAAPWKSSSDSAAPWKSAAPAAAPAPAPWGAAPPPPGPGLPGMGFGGYPPQGYPPQGYGYPPAPPMGGFPPPPPAEGVPPPPPEDDVPPPPPED